MINDGIYLAIEVINSIFFILSFFVMIRKIGYSYKAKGIFLNIINVALVILLIKTELANFIIQKYIMISIILLFLICKISYSFNFKKL